MDMHLSIAIPYYAKMDRASYFLRRCLNSIYKQTFKDYEVVVTEDGKMAENTNSAIRKSKGELIKILYMDDYLAHENALQDIVDTFKGEWLITGSDNNPSPYFTSDIHLGNNKLGSPSALTIRNGLNMYFDENLTWLLDCDFYRRLYDKYGLPDTLPGVNVNIGIHPGQASNLIPDKIKINEYEYEKEKFKYN